MPRDAAMRCHANIADMPEFFAFARVRQMHFDNWHNDRLNRIVQCDGRVGIGPGVQQHRPSSHAMRLVQPIDQMAFMVGLAEINIEAQCLRLIVQPPGNIVERVGPVNLWLTRAEQIEIGSVEDENDGAISQEFLAVELALSVVATLYKPCRKGETK